MALRDRPKVNERAATEGRLLARPRPGPRGGTVARGMQPLDREGGRDGMLYIPAAYRPDRPLPLVLMLHGAGGEGRPGLTQLRPLADLAGLILLAPDSRGRSWDLVLGDYGPDVGYIDRALARMFAEYAVDPKHVVIGGFSDGASYALSLGLTNGDLFTYVVAFSPGFMLPGEQRGRPRLFVSHGIEDDVLPIDRCSRRLVPVLRREGYDVVYREFPGPHTVPPEIALEAVRWFTGPANQEDAGTHSA